MAGESDTQDRRIRAEGKTIWQSEDTTVRSGHSADDATFQLREA